MLEFIGFNYLKTLLWVLITLLVSCSGRFEISGVTPASLTQDRIFQIADIASQSTMLNDPLVVNFSIEDSLTKVSCTGSVVAVSSDQAVVDDSDLVLGGTYPDCTLTITSVLNQIGNLSITLTMSEDTDEAIKIFDLVVTPGAPDAGNSSLIVSGPVMADGVSVSTIELVLRDSANHLIPGFSLTSFSASGSSNLYPASCSLTTDSSGEINCTLASTVGELKTVSAVIGMATFLSEDVTFIPYVATLAWSPLTHDFGNVQIATNSSSQTFTLTNSGAANATGCSAPTITDTTHFTIVTDNCTTNNVSASGGTCTVDVRANPTTVGAKTTTLSRTCTIGGTVTTTANQITTTGVNPTLVFKVQPINTAAGDTITTVEVQAELTPGVVNTSFTGSITLSLLHPPATLSGTVTQTAVAGIATFSDLVITKANNYSLAASATGYTGVASTVFTVSPLAAVEVVFSNSTTNRPVDSCMGPFTVLTQDIYGNPISAGPQVDVDLSSDGVGSGLFYSTADCSGGDVTSTTIPLSDYMSNAFYFKNDVAETLAITADPGPGLTLATKSVTINARTADTWIANTYEGGAPGARRSHSAIWTGSEMIIWGGIAGGNLNTGGRYNPVTDSWGTATTTTGAPSARFGHSAIWTGNEMIIWGGNTTGGNQNTGGRYDPATNSWGTATTTTGAPTARFAHSAIWTGSEMIIWGGIAGGNQNTGGRYNPVTDSWGAATTTTGAPTARYSHSAIWSGSEMIIWGGYSGSNLNTGGRYNPVTNTWGVATTTTGAPTARYAHSAIWTGSEMIIWGGWTTGNQNTGGRYNPVTNTWGVATTTTGAPTSREFHSAVWTGNEMIIWGGGANGNINNTGGRYNPVTDSWGAAISTTGAPTARYAHSAIWTGSEMIIWGGSTGSNQNTGGRYNPATNSWGTATTTTGAPTAREFHSAVWTGTEMIIWGGNTTGGNQNTGGRYDPATNSWGTATTTTGAPTIRYGHSAIWTGSEMIIWGGLNSGSNQNTGGRYDPATNSWGTATTTTGAPPARYLHSAIWTGSEMIIWGGWTTGNQNTGGRYNPATDSWGTATTITGAPSARNRHSAIWTGSEMIIWGGYNGSDSLNTGAFYVP